MQMTSPFAMPRIDGAKNFNLILRYSQRWTNGPDRIESTACRFAQYGIEVQYLCSSGLLHGMGCSSGERTADMLAWNIGDIQLSLANS
jgi:hypothetical protein